ncbi:MAG: thiamine-phosphate kinase [Nitrospirota bacterium]
MKISSMGEFGLIRTIRKQFLQTTRGLSLGIGDDAAAFSFSPGMVALATTDMLIEHVHFDLSFTDFYSLGWKSAAVNISDIAAMGGCPRFCLTSLAIPSSIVSEHIAAFYRGFRALISQYQTVLVGGDTCSSQHDFIVSVTVLGEIEKRQMVTRSGAKPGDRIFVTNTLGDSAAGLELLKTGVRNKASGMRKLIEKHLRPIPRVEWARMIVADGCATAMIDISDGLSSDLGHLCEESGVGAIVHAEMLPCSSALVKSTALLKQPLLEYFLHGGEEYELLFTTSPAKIRKLKTLGIPIAEIGEITRSTRRMLVSGNKKTVLSSKGYDHFCSEK